MIILSGITVCGLFLGLNNLLRGGVIELFFC